MAILLEQGKELWSGERLPSKGKRLLWEAVMKLFHILIAVVTV